MQAQDVHSDAIPDVVHCEFKHIYQEFVKGEQLVRWTPGKALNTSKSQ
jgi:hypothetical protein